MKEVWIGKIIPCIEFKAIIELYEDNQKIVKGYCIIRDGDTSIVINNYSLIGHRQFKDYPSLRFKFWGIYENKKYTYEGKFSPNMSISFSNEQTIEITPIIDTNNPLNICCEDNVDEIITN